MPERTRWRSVWARKGTELHDDGSGIPLGSLIAADGFNTGFGDIREDAWVSFVSRECARLGLGPGDSLLEIGCGSGAFLYVAHSLGIEVAGVDYSASLIGAAARVMPSGTFTVQDADALDASGQTDATVACSVFQYFENADYARRVIERMCGQAKHSVGILDVPDDRKAAEALAYRQGLAGGAKTYAEKYAGLEHQSYDRGWMSEVLYECGASDVRLEEQSIVDYPNSKFRFNAYASFD